MWARSLSSPRLTLPGDRGRLPASSTDSTPASRTEEGVGFFMAGEVALRITSVKLLTMFRALVVDVT